VGRAPNRGPVTHSNPPAALDLWGKGKGGGGGGVRQTGYEQALVCLSSR